MAERFERRLDVRLSHAHAGVAHAQHGLAVVARGRHDHLAAGAGKSDRVAEQTENDLAHRRASATACESAGVSAVRMMIRALLACGCMTPTHCWVRSLRSSSTRSARAGRSRSWTDRQIVEQRNKLHSRRVHVLEIFAVTCVADGAEVLGHDHLGEADHGIERRANFVVHLAEEVGLRRRRLVRLAPRGAIEIRAEIATVLADASASALAPPRRSAWPLVKISASADRRSTAR